MRDFDLVLSLTLTPWTWLWGWYDDREHGGRTKVLDLGPLTIALTELHGPGERHAEKQVQRLLGQLERDVAETLRASADRNT